MVIAVLLNEEKSHWKLGAALEGVGVKI